MTYQHVDYDVVTCWCDTYLICLLHSHGFVSSDNSPSGTSDELAFGDNVEFGGESVFVNTERD